MSAADQLPSNRAPHEIALAAAMTDELPVPIVAALDPMAAPVSLLPWLAVHYGARLWYSDWSEARKRLVVDQAPLAAFEVGTRAGAIRFLGYVDADLLDAVAYPIRAVAGRAVAGRTPVGHPPHLARYLVRVVTHAPPRSAVAGRAVAGRARAKTPPRTPFHRCCEALVAVKAVETEYRADFGHRRPVTIDDGFDIDAGLLLGAFVDRRKL